MNGKTNNMIHLLIITGSSSGIGSALALEALKKENYLVLGLSRTNPINHSNFIFKSFDFSMPKNLRYLDFPNFDEVSQVTLVNNAGILGEINTLDQLSWDSLDEVITVNYTAPLYLIRRFLDVFQEKNLTKTIINISSGAATSPYASWANYCSSKAALEMLTKSINEEQKDKKYPVKCFSIAPGVVDTNMQMQIRNTPEKNFNLQSKFIDLYNENKLFTANYVAQKLLEVIEFPNQFDSVFRIL